MSSAVDVHQDDNRRTTIRMTRRQSSSMTMRGTRTSGSGGGTSEIGLTRRATCGAFLCMLLCLVFPEGSLPDIDFFPNGEVDPDSDAVQGIGEGSKGSNSNTTDPRMSSSSSSSSLHSPRIVVQADDAAAETEAAKDARNLRRIRRMTVMEEDVGRGASDSSRSKKNKSKRSASGGSKDSRKKELSSSTGVGAAAAADSSSSSPCDPTKVDLSSYPQWADETGFWIGQYDLYQGDGTHHETNAWNYPYSNYTGFITGNAVGPSYRQRNVFVYRPQESEKCSSGGGVWGEGQCGVNGNVKLFEADQTVTGCSSNPAFGGDLTGDFGDHFFTTTELVGRQANNAVLYQVWLKAGSFGLSPDEDLLFQSQLTTITRRKKDRKNPTVSPRSLSSSGVYDDDEEDDEEVFRTRSAQEFEVFDPTKRGQPIRVSFYRERKVTESQFYKQLDETLREYNILPSDVCTWKNGPVGNVIPSGHQPGIDSCRKHLEESFQL